MLRFTRWIFSLIAVLSAPAALAYLPATAFWKKHTPILRITTSAQTALYASRCSAAVTVQTANYLGATTSVSGSPLTVNLSGTGSAVLYSDAACTTPATTVAIPVGLSSVNFYFKDSVVESTTIGVSATGYQTPPSQTHTMVNHPFIWTGGGSDSNWNTNANWSGGAPPSTASHAALFNSTCTSNCSPTINVALNIGGIRIDPGYTGTITQGAVAVTLGTNGWVQQDGNFVGSASNITVNGPVYISSGSYQSTTGTFTFGGGNANFYVASPGSYTQSSGTFTTTGSAGSPPVITFPSGVTLPTVNLGNGANGTAVTVNGNPTINGTLTLNVATNGAFSGTLTAKGNVVFQSCPYAGAGLVILKGNAGVTQTLSGAAAGNLPSLSIQSSGTVVFNTTAAPIVGGSFTYVSGSVTWTNTTIQFLGVSGASITSNGLEFPNVKFGVLNGQLVTLNDTMVINGDLGTFSAGCTSCKGVVGGAITLKGNFNDNTNWASAVSSGDGMKSPLTFAGTTGAQTWTATAGSAYGATVTINNSNGVVMGAGSSITAMPSGGSFPLALSSGNLNLSGGTVYVTTLSLNGNKLIKSGGTLKVGSTTVGNGSPLYGGTVDP